MYADPRYGLGQVLQEGGQGPTYVVDELTGQSVPLEVYNMAGVEAARVAAETACATEPEPDPEQAIAYADPTTGEIIHTTWADVPESVKRLLRSNAQQKCADAVDAYATELDGAVNAWTTQRQLNEQARREAEEEEQGRIEEEARRHEEERRRVEQEVEEENRRRAEEAAAAVEEGLRRALEEARLAREEAEQRYAEWMAQAEEERRNLLDELGSARDAGDAEALQQLQDEYQRRIAQILQQAELERVKAALRAAQEQQAAEGVRQAQDAGEAGELPTVAGLTPTALALGLGGVSVLALLLALVRD